MYSAAQRRAWACYALQPSSRKRDKRQESQLRQSEQRTAKKPPSRLPHQQESDDAEVQHVFRQQFTGQTGRYEGVVEVVPRVRWFEVISTAHSAAIIAELEKTAFKNERTISPLALSTEHQQQQQEGNGSKTCAATRATANRTDGSEKETQLVPDVEGIPIPLDALQWQLQHELVVENVPREAAAIWLALLPPRLDPILPAMAIQGLENGEVREYAEQLLLKRPLWVEELCRAISTDPSAVTAAKVSTMFEQRCWYAKEHNCGICHDNFAMDNKRPDAPCRARDKSISLCNHEYCTTCWHALARRSDPAAAQIPCPTCRGDVKPFLAEVPYQASLQLVAVEGANADANGEPADAGPVIASGSDESFELLDDASVDAGSNRTASHAESMEDDISIDGGESSDGDNGSDGSVRTDTRPSGGIFSLLLVDGGPASAAGSGKWSVLCRVASSGLSPADLGRLGASCRLFRTPLLGDYSPYLLR